MRYLVLAIFVLLATQPLRASFCDMCAGQKAVHADMSDVQMSDAQISGTGMHAGMNHGGDSHAMDCCDDEPSGSDDTCAGMAHCGACPAGTVAVNPTMPPAFISVAALKLDFSANPPVYRSSSPPFRPPIS